MLEVKEIPRSASLESFIDLQWEFNRNDPYWIPPLRMSVAGVLKRAKHPFHAHAEVAYFLAIRDGRPAGRIAAIHNQAHNDFHNDRLGFFGVFECEDSQETADALFDAAAAWLSKRGLEGMRGPVNLSTNDEISSPGILVDGFRTHQYFMMSHNPPYYAGLFENAGFSTAKDLITFTLEESVGQPKRGTAILDRILARENATVRSLDMKNFQRDLDKIKQVYNAAWSLNWGFVPMSDAEFEHLASEFKPVVDASLCLIAESDGEPIGFSLALPDLNEAIRRIPNGRLFPFGIFKFLWYRRRITGIRVLTLGFKPKYHRAGLGTAFYVRTFSNGIQRGYDHGEASWILEDNHEMVRAMERMGAERERRYRVFERSVNRAEQD